MWEAARSSRRRSRWKRWTSSDYAKAIRPTRSSRHPTSSWRRTERAEVLTRRRFVGAALAAAMPGVASAQRRVVVDGAGRRVEVPNQVRRVFAAGGPASIFVYTLAPDALLGWTRAPTEEERRWLPAKYAELPTMGRLTGRGNTANVEVVLAARPDVVLDFGTIGEIYVSLADRVQEQTKVPYVLLDGSLGATARAYTLAGDVL